MDNKEINSIKHQEFIGLLEEFLKEIYKRFNKKIRKPYPLINKLMTDYGRKRTYEVLKSLAENKTHMKGNPVAYITKVIKEGFEESIEHKPIDLSPKSLYGKSK